MQGNNVDMAPFKPFAESTAAAWKEINSCPLSSLHDIGYLVEKYRLWVQGVPSSFC